MDPLAATFERFNREGDLHALGEVFDAVAPQLLGVAMHLCGNPSVVFGYNVWVGTNRQGQTVCGGTDRSASSIENLGLLFRDPAAGADDFHLVPASPAQDFVTPTSADYALADDVDRDARPTGTAREAGADEAP